MTPEGSLLEQIITPGQLRTLFQPIFSFTSGVPTLLGLECLTRGPAGTNLEIADVLFEYARRKRREELVDVACMKAAFANSKAFNRSVKLFINVHASTLGKSQLFVDTLQDVCISESISISRVVIEIVEHSPCWNRSEFATSVSRLRAMGAQIAVDDLGVAYSSFKMILDTTPEYLKIDMYITRSCSEDPIRRAMIRSFQQLAEGCRSEIVAEGIESKEDMRAILDMGVYYFQGYLFSKPRTPAEAARLSREEWGLSQLPCMVPEPPFPSSLTRRV